MVNQNAFEVRPSEQWAGRFEVTDTLNKTTWGPFADTAAAQCQVSKLEHLEELRRIEGRVGELERTIWEEITIESESGARVKKLGDNMLTLIETTYNKLQREQAARLV